MRKAFLVADLYHRICSDILHDLFQTVVNGAYKKFRVFVCKAAAGCYVSIGVNVEYVAGALTVIFLEPAAGLPGAGVVTRVSAGQSVDGDIFGEAGGVTGGGATR